MTIVATRASRAHGLGSRDDGFTLVELLVVMIILGILAAIAIPALVNQRAKARDTSTKADVTNVGKEVATYFVDGEGTLTLDLAVQPGHAVLSDGATTTTILLTNGTAAPSSGETANLNSPTTWCVSLTNPAGAVRNYKYSAQNGLQEGTCS